MATRVISAVVASGPMDSDFDETAIDSLEQALPELRNFIPPGGSTAAAALHLTRGVCRRAERRVATLGRAEGIVPTVPTYLNWLADMLFVAARYANHAADITDTLWSGQAQPMTAQSPRRLSRSVL